MNTINTYETLKKIKEAKCRVDALVSMIREAQKSATTSDELRVLEREQKDAKEATRLIEEGFWVLFEYARLEK